jgi:hypothetical protein
MALEDFLLPDEQIRLQSKTGLEFAGKGDYEFILTDKRILLYARRGLVVKKDDLVAQKLDELHGIKYKEKGLISKKGILEIEGNRTKMDLEGPADTVKALYQQVMQFM